MHLHVVSLPFRQENLGQMFPEFHSFGSVVRPPTRRIVMLKSEMMRIVMTEILMRKPIRWCHSGLELKCADGGHRPC